MLVGKGLSVTADQRLELFKKYHGMSDVDLSVGRRPRGVISAAIAVRLNANTDTASENSHDMAV